MSLRLKDNFASAVSDCNRAFARLFIEYRQTSIVIAAPIAQAIVVKKTHTWRSDDPGLNPLRLRRLENT
jgi:hypothetical protein